MKKSNLVTLLVSLVLSACNMPGITKDPEVATFKSEPISAPVLQNYEQEDLYLTNNKMFVWRENMTPTQVATAQIASREIDDLDGQAIVLNGRKNQLSNDFKPVFDRQLAITKRCGAIKSRTTKLNKDKDAEMKKEKPSEEVIKKIEGEVATLQQEKTVLETEKADNDVTLAPVQKEISGIDAELQQNQDLATERIRQLNEAVVWFLDQEINPIVILKTAEDGSVFIEISKWKYAVENADATLAGGEKTFSTADGSIVNARYNPRGGIYEFQLNDGLNIYLFKVARLRRGDPSGRLILTGDIERRVLSADGSYTSTKGVAKFIDRKN